MRHCAREPPPVSLPEVSGVRRMPELSIGLNADEITEELRGIRRALEGIQAALSVSNVGIGGGGGAVSYTHWMPAREVMRRLHISKNTLNSMAERGQIERCNFGEQSPRYRMREDFI